MKRLRRWAVDYLVAFLVILSGMYLFCSAMPTGFWATYHEIVIEDADASDERILLRSIRTVARASDLGGLDVLFCDLDKDGEFGHYSSQPWQSDDVRPTAGSMRTGPWSYAGRLPAPGTSCFMRSVITLRLPFGITRQLPAVYSDPFLIGPVEQPA